MVNVVIGVEGTLTVAAGNEIATRAEQRLRRNLDFLRHVSVHYHPSREGKAVGTRRAKVIDCGRSLGVWPDRYTLDIDASGNR